MQRSTQILLKYVVPVTKKYCCNYHKNITDVIVVLLVKLLRVIQILYYLVILTFLAYEVKFDRYLKTSLAIGEGRIT